MTVDFNRVEQTDVLLALTEYDELGAEDFLDAYGFKADSASLIVHEGRTYGLEAILGVAYGYATGTAAKSGEFSGGLESAVKVLESLGFEVQANTGPASPRDASEVGSSAARAAWAEAARPVLLEVAGRYRGTITYKKLATAVQESTAITTTQLMHQWIGDVLGQVTDDCESRSEPLLSSLCVSIQGSVGQGYADAVEHARGDRPSDPDEHAAHERLECYRHWEAEGLPRDGGTALRLAHFKTVRKPTASKPTPRATTPRKTTARTTTPAAEAPAPKPIPLCPTCFTQVPASGVCDYCD